TSRLALTAGTRLDGMSGRSVELSPRVGLSYDWNARHRYRALIGRVFRYPSLNDLYWNEPNMKGNPHLRPEHGWALEVGGDHRLSRAWSVSWTAFQRFMNDLLRWTLLDPDDASNREPLWIPRNIDRTRTFGVELIGTYSPQGPWEATLRYTYIDARDRSTGERLELIPPHEAAMQVTWRGESTLVSLGVRHRGARRDFGSDLPAHTVVGAAAVIRLQPRLYMHVDVENLFNTKFEERAGYPMPGRALWTSLRYEF